MTVNEAQELAILSVFITHKIEKFSAMAMPSELYAAMGSGASAIIKNMVRDGMLTDSIYSFSLEHELTQLAKDRYILLKKKKGSEKIVSAIGWITLFGAL